MKAIWWCGAVCWTAGVAGAQAPAVPPKTGGGQTPAAKPAARADANFPARLHIAMGLPAKASTDPNDRDAFLLARKQYVASYSDRKRTPNWVSWHLNRAGLPSDRHFRRQEFFTPDPLLPRNFTQVEHFEYHARYGFDRGHLCPAADRSLNDDDNRATFLTSNIVPQAPNCNQLGWERFERFCRELAQQNQEVFIVAGPHGKGGEGANGPATTIGRTGVLVPSHTWKVVLALPAGKTSPRDVTVKTKTYALITPNNQSVGEDWKKYAASVADVEKLTGFKFFSEVPAEIAKEIKGTASAKTPQPATSPTPKKPKDGGAKKPLKGGFDK